MTERQIFEAASEIADAAKREAFLTHACEGQPDLRAAVDALLQAHMNASSDFLAAPAAHRVFLDETQTIVRPIGDADDDGPDEIEENAAEAAVLKLLTPSTKPGSLGQLAHYEVIEFLGRGAFGVVLKAFDEKLHRMVAVKMMNPELAATSPPRKRFLREARSSAAVRHENIVAIHAVEEQPVPYLVMEYIPGKTLQQWLNDNGPLEVKDILKFGQQLASGLAAAHAQSLIHRDIKPANILIDDAVESRAKITDFGLARAVDDASMTQSGLIAGTPMYMAPEQARGQTLDHRADLFSLGSVLYTMTSGRPPFRAANTIAVLRRVCEDTPRPIREVIATTPEWLDAIIAKLLAKEPDDRYQTAKEVADLLARCQSELQLTGKVTCVEPRAGSVSARSQPDGSPAATALMPAISEGSRPSLAGQSPPRGVLGQAWHDWWSERDRWVVLSLETVLVIACLVCMLCFVSMGQSSGHDPEGHVTFDYQLGRPAPWYRFEVYPDTTTPFRMGFQPFASSVLVGCLGCLAWWVYWRIEKVRNPQASRWAGPRFMLGIWAIGAVIAVGIGQWQGYAHLSQPQVAITAPSASGRREPVESPAPSPTPASTEGSRPPLATKTGWQGWPADAPAPAIAPFDATQAKQHQEEWAAYLKVPPEYTNSLGMQFVLIPPGEFTMGSTPTEIETAAQDSENDAHRQACVKSSGPQHKVTLTQPIYLGMHELTQKQYAAITHSNPSYCSSTGAGKAVVAGLDTQNCPVDGVSWLDATAFCNQLSQRASLPSFYSPRKAGESPAAGSGYRLPTEAEWEFACRAGTATSFWTGTEESPLIPEIWAGISSKGMTHPVGQTSANPFGLHEMHGNLWEWVSDWWKPGYYERFVDTAALNPRGWSSTETQRVIRGGGWDSSVVWCRSAYRVAVDPNIKMYSLGVRVALSIDAVKAERQLPIDLDRELAEWAMSTSNPYVVIVGREARSPAVVVTKLADLPAGEFYVTDLVLNVDGETFSDADLERMARVSHLRQIYLIEVKHYMCPLVTDRGIEALSQAAFAGGLEQLVLWTPLPSITDAAIPSINRFTGLREMHWRCPSVSDAGVQQLELPELRLYSSRNIPYTNGSLSRLADRSPQISKLGIESTPLGGSDLTPLARWKLNQLIIVGCGLSDVDLPFIGSLIALKLLLLNDNPGISGEGISHLQPLENLEHLELYHSKIDDESLLVIAGFAKLQRLNLNDTLITDLGLESLAGMQALIDLNIGSCPGVTEAGVRKLEAALPKCQITSDLPKP